MPHTLRISHTLRIAALAIAFTALGCGPALTTPASSNISGTWFAPGPAGGLTNVTVVLTQTSDGNISGTYAATGTPNFQFCPATGPCPISGIVNGTNNVFQVFFELIDAGQFTGQLTTVTELKGAMSRTNASGANSTGPIQFTKS